MLIIRYRIGFASLRIIPPFDIDSPVIALPTDSIITKKSSDTDHQNKIVFSAISFSEYNQYE